MIFNSIVLGIVEGLTEFLPISSTGHLIIVNKFISFGGDFANFFDVVIQAGAILAVIVYFWREIFPFKSNESFKEYLIRWFKILCAFIPSAILGYLFADKIEKHFFNAFTVGIALIVGGVMLMLAEDYAQKRKERDIQKIGFIDAFLIGLFQCLSLIPGMSRSGSTIIGGFLRGLSRKSAAEFSFLLAIPTICGATLFKLMDYDGSLASKDVVSLSIGTLVSFIVALAVIAFFMNFIRTRSLKIFAYYRILLGIIVLIFIRK
jgi:undecaprenyl-diphosphatase